MFKSPVLQIKPFRLLLIGQLVSFFGDTLYYVLFAFMVQKITGKVGMVGWIGAAESFPLFLFSPIAGIIADKFDRKKIMLLADIIPFVILTTFALFIFIVDKPPVWSLFVVAPCLSTAMAFMLPTRNAAMPKLVPKEHLLEANALFSMFRNIVPMASLALSATVLGALWGVSQKWFFLVAVLVNGVTFLVSALYTSRLPSMVADGKVEKHPLEDAVEGFKYVAERKELLTLLCLSTVTSLIFAPFFVTYVKANKDWFGDLPGTLAFFELAFFVGMVTGSMIVGKFKIRRIGIAFIWGVACVGAGIAAMAFSKNIWLFAFWNLAAGIMMPFFQIPINAYMQMSVPDALRGRVNGTFNMVAMGVMPIGQSLGGLIIQSIGLMATFLAMGCASVCTAFAGMLSKPFREASLPNTSIQETVIAALSDDADQTTDSKPMLPKGV